MNRNGCPPRVSVAPWRETKPVGFVTDVGMGVAVGTTGVEVGATGVAVGSTAGAVAVGGTGEAVAVGTAGVDVTGTRVDVGTGGVEVAGMRVDVGGTGVGVEGTAVALGTPGTVPPGAGALSMEPSPTPAPANLAVSPQLSVKTYWRVKGFPRTVRRMMKSALLAAPSRGRMEGIARACWNGNSTVAFSPRSNLTWRNRGAPPAFSSARTLTLNARISPRSCCMVRTVAEIAGMQAAACAVLWGRSSPNVVKAVKSRRMACKVSLFGATCIEGGNAGERRTCDGSDRLFDPPICATG